MLATKCVQGRIIGLTKRKKELLDNEYSEFNRLARFVSACKKKGIEELCSYKSIKDKYNIYSLTKTQALRNCRGARKEQPLIIHNQSVKAIVNNNKITPLWIRIAVYGVRKGIWLPVQTSKDKIQLVKECKICGVKINKYGEDYCINITSQKEVTIKSCSNILSVDLEEKIIACVSGTSQKQPLFLGKEVRGIRRHYNWLRKRLGEKKLLSKIKQIGCKEQNKVNSILHKISKIIVDISVASNSIIILGNLKGIREHAKGRRMRRIVSSMPYFKLSEMITYKAAWFGIPVKKISEANTSRTCSHCGYCDKANRKTQGQFKCLKCGYELNADYNATKNITRGWQGISLLMGL